MVSTCNSVTFPVTNSDEVEVVQLDCSVLRFRRIDLGPNMHESLRAASNAVEGYMRFSAGGGLSTIYASKNGGKSPIPSNFKK